MAHYATDAEIEYRHDDLNHPVLRTLFPTLALFGALLALFFLV